MSGTTAATPFQLPNDWVLTIPIESLTASGAVVGLPAGDVETAAVTSNPTMTPMGLNAVIGTTAAGAPALVVNALVDGSQSAATIYTVTVSDSAGETPSAIFFQIVADNTPVSLFSDLPDATHTTQAVPPAG